MCWAATVQDASPVTDVKRAGGTSRGPTRRRRTGAACAPDGGRTVVGDRDRVGQGLHPRRPDPPSPERSPKITGGLAAGAEEQLDRAGGIGTASRAGRPRSGPRPTGGCRSPPRRRGRPARSRIHGVRRGVMNRRGKSAAGLPHLHGHGLQGGMMGDQVRPPSPLTSASVSARAVAPGGDIRCRRRSRRFRCRGTPGRPDPVEPFQYTTEIDVAVAVQVGGGPDDERHVVAVARGRQISACAVGEQHREPASGTPTAMSGTHPGSDRRPPGRRNRRMRSGH